MDVDVRLLVRVFLVVGGLAYVGWGLVDGGTTFLALGALAVALGLYGIWRDRPGDAGR
jgi:hypothetical protein